MSTVVSFHAHPDDEALLTGGTLAKLAADDHRVVIATATDGSLGARNRSVDDSVQRLSELAQSAKALGAAQVEYLGYADSGHGPELYPDPPGRQRFARAETDDAARKLAALLGEVRADLLLSYDEMGGYGHRDHLKVHEVGRRAASSPASGSLKPPCRGSGPSSLSGSCMSCDSWQSATALSPPVGKPVNS